MSEEYIKALEEIGWIIECQSPLEIRHVTDGSFITGNAAKSFLQALNMSVLIKQLKNKKSTI